MQLPTSCQAHFDVDMQLSVASCSVQQGFTSFVDSQASKLELHQQLNHTQRCVAEPGGAPMEQCMGWQPSLMAVPIPTAYHEVSL